MPIGNINAVAYYAFILFYNICNEFLPYITCLIFLKKSLKKQCV